MIMLKRSIAYLALLTVAWLLPGLAYAQRTWNVYRDGSGDAPFIQAAIDSAKDGDTVLVWPGVYDEGAILSYYKSITLMSAGGREVTSIHNLFVRGRTSPPGNAVTVAGFSFNPVEADYGAFGVSAVQSFTMRDCEIRGSPAHCIVRYVSDLEIADCRFIENRYDAPDTEGGGALYVEVPAVPDGGSIRRCQFIDNYWAHGVPGWYGGGALNVAVDVGGSGFRIENCLFLRNECRSGGAAFIEGGEVMFVNNTVIDNRAEDGAVFRTEGRFGGTYGNVFAGNEMGALYSADGSYCRCNVYWQNRGNWTGCGMIDDANVVVDPRFCDPEGEDYRLRESSPLIPENYPAAMARCEGIIGAFGVGCDPNPTIPISWGRLKNLYRP